MPARRQAVKLKVIGASMALGLSLLLLSLSLLVPAASANVLATDSPHTSYQSSYIPLLHHPYSSSWHLFSEEPFSANGTPYGLESSTLDRFDSAILKTDSRFFDTAGDPYERGRYLVFGTAADARILSEYADSGDSVFGAAASLPDAGFYALAMMSGDVASELSSMGIVVIQDRPLDQHDAYHASTISNNVNFIKHVGGSVQSIYRTTDSTDATGIPGMLGLGVEHARNDSSAIIPAARGEGITVAIVDTGVDFSNPDIQNSLARDPDTNHPIMLDPDGQGIVITNHTFYAHIDDDGVVKNHAGPIPEGFDSLVYVTQDGVFLDIERGGKKTDITVYNSLYPEVGNAPVFTGIFEHDMKIGDTARDYIRSQSGAYRLGAIFQAGAPGLGPDYPTGIQVVPVMVVDSLVPGVYDTIIPDMSSSWLDYVRTPDETPDFDFDFTDESPIILGSGGEFLVYDSDDDGIMDYTAGTAGARVLDVYSVTNSTLESHHTGLLHAVNGTLLPGLDPDGRFFGIMTDIDGHGTGSSATIVSAGSMKYDIYNDTSEYVITGAAPGAKILPVKALWLGDAVYGWLWSAGFENRGSNWEFSGDTRADIISNSWGVSSFPNMGHAPGYDVLSLVLDALAVPRSLDEDYPGVVMISSAGNSGHGYGTLGIPGAASFGISVGASTNNVFVGYGPFKDQPRFGSTTAPAGDEGGIIRGDNAGMPHDDDVYEMDRSGGASTVRIITDDGTADTSETVIPNQNRGHIVDFSSRGPGVIGDVRPDIVGVGAYGFVPRNMMGAVQDANTRDPFSMFGGTSMAAPMVAGAAAVLMSQLQSELVDYDPFIIRNILMSTARDTHNDPFTQGAGLADAGAALDYVYGRGGVFAAYNDGSYSKIRSILQPAIAAADIADSGIGALEIPDRKTPMTAWFAGHLEPGQRTSAEFAVENPGGEELQVDVTPYTLSLVHHTRHEGTTVPHQQDPVLNKTGSYAPNYVRLADVYDSGALGGLFDDDDGSEYAASLPHDASLLVLNVNFDFADFMNKSTDVYADDLGIASLYLYDWVDADGNLEITSDELDLVTRGGSWGTVQEIRVSDPASIFDGVPTVGLYPVPARYSYWAGQNGLNATGIDYVVSASYYAKEPWDAVWPESRFIVVPPRDTGMVRVTLVTHVDDNKMAPGVRQGFIAFEGKDHTVNAPVSFVVKAIVDDMHDGGLLFGSNNDGHGTVQSDYNNITSSAHYNAGNGAAAGPGRDPGDYAAGGILEYPDVLYGNGYVKGAFDMVGRYMAGDWRNHYFEIKDDSIKTASVKVSWKSPDTSMSVFAIDPAGRIIQTNVPSGVFGHFLDWPSVDWLGSSPFSEGGGFYHVAGGLDLSASTDDENDKIASSAHTGTFMIIPINGTGTYAIMTHATLFGGESVVEPITVEITFHADRLDTATMHGMPADTSINDHSMEIKPGMMPHGEAARDAPTILHDPAAPAVSDDPDAAVGDKDNDSVNDEIAADDATESDTSGNAAGDTDNSASKAAATLSDAAPALQPASDGDFEMGIIIGMAAGVIMGSAVIFAVLQRRSSGRRDYLQGDASGGAHATGGGDRSAYATVSSDHERIGRSAAAVSNDAV